MNATITPDPLSLLAESIEQVERAANVARNDSDHYLATMLDTIADQQHAIFALLSAEAAIFAHC